MTETKHSSRIPLLVFLPLLVILIVWFLPGGHYVHTEELDGEFALPAGARRVVVRIQKGNVRVAVGGPGHVTFRARALRVAHDEEAFDVLRAQKLTLVGELVEGSGEFLLSPPPFPEGLEVDYEAPTREGGKIMRKGLRGMRQFDVRLKVPPQMPVRVECSLGGSVTVEYLSAPVAVHTGIGTVHLKVVTADATVRAEQGDVVVDQHRDGLDILTRRGRVLVLMSEVLRPVKLRTLHGDVKCTVPRHAAFELDARSRGGGGIVSDFDLPRFPLGEEGQRMQGKVRGAGPLLHAESGQGTVSVLVER